MPEIVLQHADPELSGETVNNPLKVTGFDTAAQGGINSMLSPA
jgi:hypothetical protein